LTDRFLHTKARKSNEKEGIVPFVKGIKQKKRTNLLPGKGNGDVTNGIAHEKKGPGVTGAKKDKTQLV